MKFRHIKKIAVRTLNRMFHQKKMNDDLWKIYKSPHRMELSKSAQIKNLVEQGADINCDNSTLLHEAIQDNNYDIIQTLIELGIDVNSKNSQAMRHCAAIGNLKVMRLLQANGGNTDTKHGEGCTSPLFLAAERGYFEIVRFLVSECGVTTSAVKDSYASQEIKEWCLKYDESCDMNSKLVKDLNAEQNKTIYHHSAKL